MKIICISASQIPSDTANSIQAMKACQALAQLGHEITLLVPEIRRPSSVVRRQEWNILAEHYGLATPFTITRVSGRTRRLFPWMAIRRARALHPDLLYVWPLQSAVFGLLHRLPVILEMHDLPTGRLGPLWYRLFLRMRGNKRLLVITRALQDRLDERYGAARDAVIAPNGVDLERFANLPDPVTARRQIGLPAAVTVACTGHLYAGRGADLFLALAKATPQANFLWVGGRPEDVETWQARATALRLSNIIFTGFIPNEKLPLYQAAADVLLMPYGHKIGISSGAGHSAEISSPMKMFEYLAAGRAILTSDLPVLREVLNENNAVFCPPEDADAWQSALSGLIRDSKRRQALSQRAHSAAQQYSWTERAKRILDGFVESGK